MRIATWWPLVVIVALLSLVQPASNPSNERSLKLALNGGTTTVVYGGASEVTIATSFSEQPDFEWSEDGKYLYGIAASRDAVEIVDTEAGTTNMVQIGVSLKDIQVYDGVLAYSSFSKDASLEFGFVLLSDGSVHPLEVQSENSWGVDELIAKNFGGSVKAIWATNRQPNFVSVYWLEGGVVTRRDLQTPEGEVGPISFDLSAGTALLVSRVEWPGIADLDSFSQEAGGALSIGPCSSIDTLYEMDLSDGKTKEIELPVYNDGIADRFDWSIQDIKYDLDGEVVVTALPKTQDPCVRAINNAVVLKRIDGTFGRSQFESKVTSVTDEIEIQLEPIGFGLFQFQETQISILSARNGMLRSGREFAPSYPGSFALWGHDATAAQFRTNPESIQAGVEEFLGDGLGPSAVPACDVNVDDELEDLRALWALRPESQDYNLSFAPMELNGSPGPEVFAGYRSSESDVNVVYTLMSNPCSWTPLVVLRRSQGQAIFADWCIDDSESIPMFTFVVAGLDGGKYEGKVWKFRLRGTYLDLVSHGDVSAARDELSSLCTLSI